MHSANMFHSNCDLSIKECGLFLFSSSRIRESVPLTLFGGNLQVVHLPRTPSATFMTNRTRTSGQRKNIIQLLPEAVGKLRAESKNGRVRRLPVVSGVRRGTVGRSVSGVTLTSTCRSLSSYFLHNASQPGLDLPSQTLEGALEALAEERIQQRVDI